MRFKWKYKKHKTDEKRGSIRDTLSIHERPKGAANRSRFGHWESDTVLGMRKTGCIGTHVERKSGFLVAFKLKDQQDKSFTIATVKAFKDIPDKLKKSFTVDNGKEFLYHREITENTGMKVYFCDPYSPWQRGTNENTNDILRFFFPKGYDFHKLTQARLDAIVDMINDRPRKCLNWKSPREIFVALA